MEHWSSSTFYFTGKETQVQKFWLIPGVRIYFVAEVGLEYPKGSQVQRPFTHSFSIFFLVFFDHNLYNILIEGFCLILVQFSSFLLFDFYFVYICLPFNFNYFSIYFQSQGPYKS